MVQQIMISHYATRGRRLPLLAVLEEATSESSTRVLVFILTVNNDWSQTIAIVPVAVLETYTIVRDQ